MRYLALLFICFSFSAFAQDVIMKKDGSKIDAKVVEITTTMIKYRSWEQQDGPIRNIAIKDVKEVIYNDGTWDNFEEKKEEIATEDKEEPVEIDVDNPYAKDPIMKNGFFVELLFGAGNNTRTNHIWNDVTQSDEYYESSDLNAGISFKLGSKWYFGQRNKWRPGIQVSWLRLGIYVNDFDDFAYGLLAGPKLLAPVNVGMTNVFKFTDDIGMEANFTTGFNMDIDMDWGEMTAGLAINPEVKFRYKKLGVGFEYMRVQGLGELRPPGTSGSYYFNPGHWNMYSLSVGIKF